MRFALACVHKCFTLTGHLKSAESKCLWSSIGNVAEAVTCCWKKKYIFMLKQKSSNLYMIGFLS